MKLRNNLISVENIMETKKYFIAMVAVFCLVTCIGPLRSVSARTIVLDEFENVTISPVEADMTMPNTWVERNAANNPMFDIDTYYISPYDGSKSVKINYQSNSSTTCETKTLQHLYFINPENTSRCNVWLYVDFQTNGGAYNFPHIAITLYNQGSYLGSKTYYFHIGTFNEPWQNNYVKLDAPSGFQQFDLSKIAAEKDFDMLQVEIIAYACGIGPAGKIIVDHMVLLNDKPDIATTTTTTAAQNTSTTTTTITTIQQFCPDLQMQSQLESCVQGLEGDQKQQALDVINRVESCLAGQTDVEIENGNLTNENNALKDENIALKDENTRLTNELTSLMHSLEIETGLLQDLIDDLNVKLVQCGIAETTPKNGVIAAPETAHYQVFRIAPIPPNEILGGYLSIVYLDDAGREIGENEITIQYNSITKGSQVIIIPRGTLFKFRVRPYFGIFQGVTIDSDSEWCHFYALANGGWHMQFEDVTDPRCSDKDFNDIVLELRVVTTTTTIAPAQW